MWNSYEKESKVKYGILVANKKVKELVKIQARFLRS